MSNVHWGLLLAAALTGSFAILISMYFLLPALGLPRLDITSVAGNWVRINGRFAKVTRALFFLLGGIAWTLLYAWLWPWHSIVGGVGFMAIPFTIASLAILPELNQFHVMVTPMPGFVWIRLGGRNSVIANLVEHMVFGLCLGLIYH